MPTTTSTCPLDCADACGVLIESTDDGRFVSLRGNPEHPYSRGVLCGKTARYGDLVAAPERLLHPLVRDGRKLNGALRRATWDEALARIAERVGPLEGERILVASYAGSMGLVARKFPERVMNALGATFTDGGICDNSADAGFVNVLGRPVGADIDHADQADALILWGCDMKRTLQHLQPAVQRLAKAGVPVFAVDIWRTDTIVALEKWGGTGVIVKPGTDAMLALAIARLAFERGYVDRAFLTAECVGAEEFEAHVRAGHDLQTASEVTGVPAALIERLAECLGQAQRPFLKAGIGFARRTHGAMSMRAVCATAAVMGAADRVHFESGACFDLPTEGLTRTDLRPGGASAPIVKHAGLGREFERNRFDAVFVWGHNLAVTCSDENRVRAGLSREDVFVVVHEHFMTETAKLADVVLPATMFMEHPDVYRSYGHRHLQYARKACIAPGEARSNVDTFAAIARALDLPRETWDVTAESLCEELLEASAERIGPEGLEALRAGRTWKMTPAPGRGTPSGKVELQSAAAAALGQPALPTYVPDEGSGWEADSGSEDARGSFWLMSTPSQHTHNSTFSHSARHVQRVGRSTVGVHPDDAHELGLAEGAPTMLYNDFGRITLPLALDPRMPRGMVRVEGLPFATQTPEGVGINALVSDEVSDLGDNSVQFSTRVDLRAADSLEA